MVSEGVDPRVLPPLTAGPHQKRLDFITVVATFGGLLFGYDTGVINGALEPMKHDLGLTAFSEGLVTGTLLIGAAIGSLVGGRMNDRLGRKKTLTILAIVFFAGTLGAVLAPNLEVMLPSRLILGFAVGGASVAVPVYLAELAPTERRGALAGRNELAIVIGQMLAFAINAVIGNVWGDLPGVWRIMLAVATVPAIALFTGMLRMPESPRWLIARERTSDALAVLRQIRNEARARAEIAQVELMHPSEAHAKAGGWRELRISWIRHIMLVACLLAIFQQTTGINSIMYYGTQVLTQAGFSSQAALIANVANGVLAVVGSAICLFVFMDRIPRRKLIVGGLAATTTCHLLIVLASYLLPEGTPKAVVILIFMVSFVFAMQSTLNVPVWVVLSELFPLDMRGFGMGVSVLILWLTNAVIAFTFPVLVQAVNIQGAFLVFVVLGIIATLTMARLLPETGNRSLEELELQFASGNFRGTDARSSK